MKRWFDLPLTVLGVAMMLHGFSFWILVTLAGAPWVPWIGFGLGVYGAWLAVGRHVISRRRGAP